MYNKMSACLWSVISFQVLPADHFQNKVVESPVRVYFLTIIIWGLMRMQGIVFVGYCLLGYPGTHTHICMDFYIEIAS